MYEDYENPVNIADINSVLSKSFFWMFMGLITSGLFAWMGYKGEWALSVNFEALALIELVVVVVFSLLFKKLPAQIVTVLYFLYAILNGVTMSVIFYAFELQSITTVLFITAAMFGVLAYFGKNTDKDLTSLGNIAFVGLWACIAVTIINYFMKVEMIDTIIDWVVIGLFTIITARDVQKIEDLAGSIEEDKLHIYGAMELYLDFINIFIRLLSIMGKRKR